MPTSTTDTSIENTQTQDSPVRYFRAGGFNQIILKEASDLKHLSNLDPTLWVASSCPTRGLDLPHETLDLIDAEKDGRIRPPEILAAVSWILAVLKDPSTLPLGSDEIRLEQLNTDHPDGEEIYRTIKRIHTNLSVEGSSTIQLAQAMDRSGIFAAVKSTGDGVIPPSASENESVARLIQDILATVGGSENRKGELGVTADGVNTFYDALKDWLEWWVRGHPADIHLLPANPASQNVQITQDANLPNSEQLAAAMQEEQHLRGQVDPDGDENKPQAAHPSLPRLNPEIFVLGDDTPAAFAAVDALRSKIEDFFRLVQLATFDPKALTRINFNDNDLSSMGGRSSEDVNAMLYRIPLAHIRAGAPLPLTHSVNPAYASDLAKLREAAVIPILGEGIDELTREQWLKLLNTLAPYETWLSEKAGAVVESLGAERISRLLHLQDRRDALEALIKVDAALAAEIAAVSKVEKLIRLHRDLFRLLNNYVSLPEFYSTDKRAIFQMGTLLIDGCALNLCMEVEDIAQHMNIASTSGVFLVYCTTKRADETRQPTICAAVTNRNAGRIRPGKNAVFYDRYGRDWDAKVVQVAVNPISLSEAVWAPFKKLGALIGSQMERFTNSRQADLEKSITNSVNQLDQQVAQGAVKEAAPPAPSAGGNSAMAIGGILAGGGVAVAALSSSVAYLVQTFSNISTLHLFYTFGIILAFIILPSLILGYIKLQARDIGMILEANGWAINGRMRIELRIAKALTQVSRLPQGSQRLPRPGEVKPNRKPFWRIVTVAVILALICWGILNWT